MSGDLVSVVDKNVRDIKRQMKSRGYRAANELRNAALEVLSGQRSGKVYKKPGSKATYRASAPGEPPARRSGIFRLHWEENVKGEGDSVIAKIENMEKKYAHYMEHGTPGGMIAPRPFVDRIREKASPAITKIYKEPYV